MEDSVSHIINNNQEYDLLVIGGDAAGMSAASQARRMNSEISIAVFEKEEYISYAACGMPYAISKVVPSYNKLLAVDREEFIKKKKISIFIHSEVLSIDFENKNILVHQNGDTIKYGYDKCVIATGAHAFLPPIKGIEAPNVFSLRKLKDSIKILEYIEQNKHSSAIIIGGGFIGLEMAEAFHALGIDTTIIEKQESVAATMSQDVQQIISKELEEHSIEIKTNENISHIEYSDSNKESRVVTETGEYTAHMIIVSIGVRPATEFLKGSQIKRSENGAIIINSQSETNIPDVYAGGDCATVNHLILDDHVYFPLGTTANKQGRVAGLQSVGVHTEKFKGIVGTQLVKVFDMEIAKTGFNQSDAIKHGFSAITESVQWKSRAGYYPESENIFVSITIDKETRKIIGSEIAGRDGAALRIDTIATAITAGMTVDDFAYCDLGYAPPFAPVWDALLAAAQRFIKRTI